MSDQAFLDELKIYVDFTDAHAAVLGELRPCLAPAFPAIVERFYAAILENPRALAVFTGGPAQIERQKAFLASWLEGLVGGVYDLEYLKLRARIGRTHVRIRLDQRYMFTAMNLVREGLHTALRGASFEDTRRALAHDALDKICDLELAIMLQTYSEDYAARLRDVERLATLGQLAGFVGHELRNPLAVMETSLHLLTKRLPTADDNALRHARRLSEQLTISRDIITALLELARDRPVERGAVALQVFFQGALADLPGAAGSGIAIELDVPEALPDAKLDANQVRQLVRNLVTNAMQALASVSAAGEKRLRVAAARDADALLLSVEDSGPGIAEEVRHRLFEPFATTRPKGLGLGLTLCRRVAEKHGGDIRVSASALGGARFDVRLPRAFVEAT